jgi:hypothetical protein
MTTPHKATPEQWEHVEQRILAIDPGCSCLIELRDRLAALEAAANSSAGLTGSPAPAGGLMQAVGAAICSIADCGDTPPNWAPEARAAIQAVAEWFDAIGYGATASILRQELRRHG